MTHQNLSLRAETVVVGAKQSGKKQLLARGRTADIYAWGDDRVLKLFQPWMDAPSIEREAAIARIVHDAGLPTPSIYDCVTVEGCTGLVYERIDGPPMLERLLTDPANFEYYAARLAELHASIQSTHIAADLPSQRVRFELTIGAAPLDDETKHRVKQTLAVLPDGDALCHSDFHPANVLMSSPGEIIVDWIDACRGNPLADVARTVVILLGDTQDNPNFPPEMRKMARRFCEVYLDRYFELRPGGRDEIEQWVPVVAAARLSEGVGEAEGWLRKKIKL
jgi:Ser/Thr protein kinase RdoA (MazF antagonist)